MKVQRKTGVNGVKENCRHLSMINKGGTAECFRSLLGMEELGVFCVIRNCGISSPQLANYRKRREKL